MPSLREMEGLVSSRLAASHFRQMPAGVPSREDLLRLLASGRLPEGEVHQKEVDIGHQQRNDHDREANFEELHERNGPPLHLRLFL